MEKILLNIKEAVQLKLNCIAFLCLFILFSAGKTGR